MYHEYLFVKYDIVIKSNYCVKRLKKKRLFFEKKKNFFFSTEKTFRKKILRAPYFSKIPWWWRNVFKVMLTLTYGCCILSFIENIIEKYGDFTFNRDNREIFIIFYGINYYV